LARKGALITAEVVCTVCGVYLSSQQDRPPLLIDREKGGAT
jgi:hypothetical protein